MSRVEIGSIATAQLEDIYDYSRDRWGSVRAERYVRGALAVMEEIAERRSGWRAVSSRFGVDGYVRRYGKHHIYWRELANGSIGIVAVLHERMHQESRARQAFLARE